MPMSVHGAIVFGFENKSWLGNQHGKHTSTRKKRFLCLATGKNLVCFSASMSCCSGPWNTMVSTKGKKNPKTSAFKWQHKFSLKAVVRGPVWLGSVPASYAPRRGQAVGPSRSQSLVSPSRHTAAGDLQHFLSREGWELTVFMKWTWPRKAFSTISLCTWKSPQLYFPSSSALSSCLLKHSSSQRTWSLPGEQQHIFGTEPPQLWVSIST